MQQHLNIVYLEHRKKLAYPENTIALRYRPSYVQVYQPNKRNFLKDKIGYHQSQSIQMKPNRQNKQGEHIRSGSTELKSNKISPQEQNIMKKYLESNKPKEKQILKLPIVQRQIPSKGRLKSGTKSNLSRSEHSEHSQRSFHQKREITSWERKRQKNAKLRRVARKVRILNKALLFIKKTKYFMRLRAWRFKMISQISDILRQILSETVFKYYKQVVGRPLSQMGEIVKKKMANQSFSAKEDIINNILDISQCLKRSSLKLDLLKFLTLVTLPYSTPPNDFFFDFQLQRLNFMSKKRFRLNSINESQIRMIVGIFLGIKLLYNSILSQPQNIPYIKLPKRIDFEGTRVIWAYKSYFLLAIIKMFENMPIFKSAGFFADWKKDDVKIIEMPHQTDEFYNMVAEKYKDQHQCIVNNLGTWIHRIAKQVIIQKQKL